MDLERVLDVFRSRDVRWLFYTGGNGSMGTAHEIDSYARANGYELVVIGIPKTIDNDLTVTDHTPGYASTAHFFATAVRDIDADNRALPGQVEIVEILGLERRLARCRNHPRASGRERWPAPGVPA